MFFAEVKGSSPKQRMPDSYTFLDSKNLIEQLADAEEKVIAEKDSHYVPLWNQRQIMLTI